MDHQDVSTKSPRNDSELSIGDIQPTEDHDQYNEEMKSTFDQQVVNPIQYKNPYVNRKISKYEPTKT